MTAAVLTASTFRAEPTLGVAAGRVLALAGAVFGLSNLFQYGVQSGALGLHEAVLGLTWPAAVGTFLVSLAMLRRAGGEQGRRVAGWSRRVILAMLALAAAMLVAAFVQRDFTLMFWMTAASPAVYALVWTVAFVRTWRVNMLLVAGVAALGALGVVARLGTPDASLIQAATLSLVALLPGLWLAFGRRL
jgi:hypothetical protein